MKAWRYALRVLAVLGTAGLVRAEDAGDAVVRRQAGMWAASIGPIAFESFNWDRKELLHDGDWNALAHPRLHYFLSPRFSVGGELYIEWEFHMTILDQFSGLGEGRFGGLVLDSRYNLLTTAFTPCVSLGLGFNAGSLGSTQVDSYTNTATGVQDTVTISQGPGISLRPGLGIEYLGPGGWFFLAMGVLDHWIIQPPSYTDRPFPYKLKDPDTILLSLSIGKAFAF